MAVIPIARGPCNEDGPVRSLLLNFFLAWQLEEVWQSHRIRPGHCAQEEHKEEDTPLKRHGERQMEILVERTGREGAWSSGPGKPEKQANLDRLLSSEPQALS